MELDWASNCSSMDVSSQDRTEKLPTLLHSLDSPSIAKRQAARWASEWSSSEGHPHFVVSPLKSTPQTLQEDRMGAR